MTTNKRGHYTKIACELCKKRHRKCCGTRPKCSSCEKNLLECVYRANRIVSRNSSDYIKGSDQMKESRITKPRYPPLKKMKKKNIPEPNLTNPNVQKEEKLFEQNLKESNIQKLDPNTIDDSLDDAMEITTSPITFTRIRNNDIVFRSPPSSDFVYNEREQNRSWSPDHSKDRTWSPDYSKQDRSWSPDHSKQDIKKQSSSYVFDLYQYVGDRNVGDRKNAGYEELIEIEKMDLLRNNNDYVYPYSGGILDSHFTMDWRAATDDFNELR